MGSCWGVGAARPRPWRRLPRWFQASSGRGRRDAARLRADGDPGQDRSIQLDELGLISVRDFLGALDVFRCDVPVASTKAEDLLPEPDPDCDQKRADRAEKQKTQY